MAGGGANVEGSSSAFNCLPLVLSRKSSAALFHWPGTDEKDMAGLPCGFALRLEKLPPEILRFLKDAVPSAGLTVIRDPRLSDGDFPPSERILLAGDPSRHRGLIPLLKERSGLFGRLGDDIEGCLDRMARPRRFLARGRNLLEDHACLLMGILNLTPDSFSDGGRYADPGAAVARGVEMAEEGADILDLGAESSRPGSEPVSVDEEKRRLLPILQALRLALPRMPLSVDTTKAAVAEAALDAGADVINDISGGRMDPAMVSLCAGFGATMVLMHMRGTPKVMQESPHYEDPVAEITAELRDRVAAAESAGYGPGRLAVDPGIGFAKRPQDNLSVLAHLEALSCLGYPILIGASRKSLIGALTGAAVGDRLPGTLALHAAAFMKGASILRVHDVKAHVQALACLTALLR